MTNNNFKYRYPNNLAAKELIFFWTYAQIIFIGFSVLTSVYFYFGMKTTWPAVLTLAFVICTAQIDPTAKPVYAYLFDGLNYVFTPEYYAYDGKIHTAAKSRKKNKKKKESDVPEGYQNNDFSKLMIIGIAAVALVFGYLFFDEPKTQESAIRLTLDDKASEVIPYDEGAGSIDAKTFIKSVTGEVTAEPAMIDTKKPGEVTVKYTVKNGSASKGFEQKFTVAEEAKVEITLNSDTVTVQQGSEFDPKANIKSVALDGAELMYSDALSNGMYTITGTVDTSVAGTYTVTVAAKDNAGNTSQKDFTVNVLEAGTEQ